MKTPSNISFEFTEIGHYKYYKLNIKKNESQLHGTHLIILENQFHHI